MFYVPEIFHFKPLVIFIINSVGKFSGPSKTSNKVPPCIYSRTTIRDGAKHTPIKLVQELTELLFRKVPDNILVRFQFATRILKFFFFLVDTILTA